MNISLSMIVKNEEDVILRCLDSVFDLCNEFIFVDTGSTDNTKQIIYDYFSSRQNDKYFNMMIYDKQFDDFVSCRNYAIEKSNGDWILTMDADEWLLYDKEKINQIITNDEIDVIGSTISMREGENSEKESHSFIRPRLFKNNGIKYGGPFVHEFLIIGDNRVHYYPIDVICTYHHHKINKNWEGRNNLYLELLEKFYNEVDKNDTRCLFYLGNSYKETYQYEKAINIYNEYLNNPSIYYNDEIYQTYWNKAECEKIIGKDDDAILTATLGTSLRPDRSELYCVLGSIFESRNDYNMAIYYYTIAKNNPIPPISLFLHPQYYFEYPMSKLCELFDKVTRYNDAEECAFYLLKVGNPSLYNKKYIEDIYYKIRYINNINGEITKGVNFLPDKNKTLIIQVPPLYDGLGDHLIFSHLPKIAKQKYDRVLLSNKMEFKGEGYKEIVWETNPFVDGWTDDESYILDSANKKYGINFYRILQSMWEISPQMNILDIIMLCHGLDNGKRYNVPEIYYKPKFNSEYNMNVFDVNRLSFNGNRFSESYYDSTYILSILDKNNIKIDGITNPNSKRLNGGVDFISNVNKISQNILNISNIFDFADMIYSSKSFTCFNTGSYWLSASLGVRSNVITFTVESTMWNGLKYFHNEI